MGVPYFHIDTFRRVFSMFREACDKAGCIPHVPKPQRGLSVREGFFRKDEFRYDAARDAYLCPAGQLLTPIRHGRLRDFEKIDYGAPKAWRVCGCGRSWPGGQGSR